MKLPEKITLPMGDVHPYPNNPRQTSDDAIEGVRRSIADYGYVQPILVDAKNVIISGHTRYMALEALGYEMVDVYRTDMPEEQARKFRLIDNRTHELSDWAHDKLVSELREWEDGVLRAYFEDIDLDIGTATISNVTQEDIDYGKERVTTVTQAAYVPVTTVVCPTCLNEFHVKTTTLPGLTPEDVSALLMNG